MNNMKPELCWAAIVCCWSSFALSIQGADQKHYLVNSYKEKQDLKQQGYKVDFAEHLQNIRVKRERTLFQERKVRLEDKATGNIEKGGSVGEETEGGEYRFGKIGTEEIGGIEKSGFEDRRIESEGIAGNVKGSFEGENVEIKRNGYKNGRKEEGEIEETGKSNLGRKRFRVKGVRKNCYRQGRTGAGRIIGRKESGAGGREISSESSFGVKEIGAKRKDENNDHEEKRTRIKDTESEKSKLGIEVDGKNSHRKETIWTKGTKNNRKDGFRSKGINAEEIRENKQIRFRSYVKARFGVKRIEVGRNTNKKCNKKGLFGGRKFGTKAITGKRIGDGRIRTEEIVGDKKSGLREERIGGNVKNSSGEEKIGIAEKSGLGRREEVGLKRGCGQEKTDDKNIREDTTGNLDAKIGAGETVESEKESIERGRSGAGNIEGSKKDSFEKKKEGSIKIGFREETINSREIIESQKSDFGKGKIGNGEIAGNKKDSIDRRGFKIGEIGNYFGKGKEEDTKRDFGEEEIGEKGDIRKNEKRQYW